MNPSALASGIFPCAKSSAAARKRRRGSTRLKLTSGESLEWKSSRERLLIASSCGPKKGSNERANSKAVSACAAVVGWLKPASEPK